VQESFHNLTADLISLQEIRRCFSGEANIVFPSFIVAAF
jgi:hypothetical protein